MTICVYNHGVIYADRAGLGRSSVPRLVEMKKLFVSPCKYFAIAVSGKIVDTQADDYRKVVSQLKSQLKIADATNVGFKLTKEQITYFGTRAVLIMTSRNIYYLAEEDKDPMFVILDKTLPAFIGSGSTMASVAMVAGKEPIDAIRIASMCDLASYETEIDRVTMAELKPY